MFNLSDAPENKSNNSDKPNIQYQKVGIYDNIRITEVKLLESGIKKSPYLELITSGVNGEVGKSSKFYLTTDKKPDKKMSAWDMTGMNLRDLIIATHNVSKNEADSMLSGIPSTDTLAKKVSAILVGRPFRAKFKGELAQNGITYSSMDRVESMQIPREATSLRFDATKDIVKQQAYQEATALPPVTTDLPF